MDILETYHYCFAAYDSRTNDWFLVGSPIPVVLILFSYLYFVLKCGPDYMKNKPPYSFKTFIKFYNIFQIITNAWIVYALLEAGWFTKLGVGCEIIDYSMDPTAFKLANIIWWTYMLKIVDLIETGLFVLRKKNRQISILHLYHHVSTILIVWSAAKYVAGGMTTFSILVNSAIHVMMYSYYFLSSQRSIMQKVTNPVKPYITIIQMVQFIVLLLHTSQALCPRSNVPKLPGYIFIINLFFNFFLFYNFYKQNYITSKLSKMSQNSKQS